MTTTTIRERMAQDVGEGGSALLTFTLQDELGAAVPLASLVTLTLTLYDRATKDAVGGGIINSKSAVDIKNANNGTVHATSGACTLKLLAADNPIVDATKTAEIHVALLRGTYNGGAGVVEKEIQFRVVNLFKVP